MIRPFDIVIVGGAVAGSAAAYFCATSLGRDARIVVLEADPSYASCATTRSAASIRHQFSTPENIRMSMFGTRFLREAPELLIHDGDVPPIGFVEGGYLFIATDAGMPVLEANHRVQRGEGADTALLDAAALRERFPWLHTEDLAGGSLGLSGEGWLDAHALMHGLRRKAIALGVEYRKARAVGFAVAQGRVIGVRLADGSHLPCAWAINTAGTGATALARSVDIDLPVSPKKRCVFHFRSPAKLPGCPLVIDPTGLWFRPEGEGFIGGIAPGADEDPDCDDFDVPPSWFDERVWPLLAARVPGFEALRLASSWAGHYDLNRFDHNVILGPHPSLPNLLFANGFSGHGLQQAPAVGRALAEWMGHGGYRTIDLSALGWARVIEGRPLLELNVV